MGLVRTLVDRVYKINNSWPGFHKDIKDLTLILRKNIFPVRMVEKVINVSRAPIRPSASPQVQQAVSTYYFKLPCVGSFTREAQKRPRKLVQRYCTNIEIKLAFSYFKVGSMISVKDPVPFDLRSRVVYKFLCAGCNACSAWARLADISRRAFVSIWAGIGIHTFINICSNPRHVVF